METKVDRKRLTSRKTNSDKNHKTNAAKLISEFITHLINTVSLHAQYNWGRPNNAVIHGRTAIPKPLITKSNAKLRKVMML